MFSNPAELMHQRKPAEYREITDTHMARQTRPICKNCAIPKNTVVRNMHIGHQKIVVTDLRNPGTRRRTTIKSRVLAYDIPVPNGQASIFIPIPSVLRSFPNRGKLINPIS